MKLKLFLAVIVSSFLFSSAPAQTIPVSTAPTPPKGYMLGPGDTISVKVLNEEQYGFVATVDEDGKIAVPFEKDPIIAKCKTENELRQEIKLAYTKYLKNPLVNFQVTERKSRPPVSVYGEVNKIQQIDLRRQATLVDLIAFSGGFTNFAGGMIQIIRTQPPMCSDGNNSEWKPDSTEPGDVPYRMYSIASLKSGKVEANPEIFPGDIIMVQKAASVYVTGEVVSPKELSLKENGMTLMEAVTQASGIRREAKTKDIKIHRLKQNSKDREVISKNLDLIKKGEEKDILLQPEDIVIVDQKKDSLGVAILKFAMGMGRTAAQAGAASVGYAVY